MKETGALLGPADKDVELVAVVANPTYRSTAFTQAFDREEGLNTVPNWLYLTGSLSQLSRGLAAVRDHRAEPARGRDVRAQRPGRGHRPDRAASARRSAPTRARARPAPSPRSPCCSASTRARRWRQLVSGRHVAGRGPRGGVRGPDRPGRGLRCPDRPAERACRPGTDRAAGHLAGHLAGHRAGHLGGHGHGRVGRVGEQLLAAVPPAHGRQPLVAGHPGRSGRQRRPGRLGRAGRHLAGGRASGPARGWPSRRWPPAATRARTGRRACSTRPWPTSRTRWPSPRQGRPWRC